MSKQDSASRKTRKAFNTIILGYQSLGAIYGDLGTSPLYTLSGVFPNNPPDKERLLGGISCIFWVFTVVVIFKYCLIVLRYGPNHNQGGQIAIYSKIVYGLKLQKPQETVSKVEPIDEDDDTYLKGCIPGDEDDLLALTRTATVNTSSSVFSTQFARSAISTISLTCALLGCSLVFSDGLLTPTTSILSAVSGIATAEPSFTDKVMPVSCAVVIVLFLIQRFGSNGLSKLFSPIILVWLITLLINGLYWICHKPEVLKAFNPYYAFKLLEHEKGISILSSVMLSITGTEAMFADVAHFGALPIQLTLLFVVYPCLMCTYFGQGAYLLINPDNFSDNLFYTAIPFGGVGSGYYWFIFVMAIFATIIASQALILGCFSILKQLINLDCCPRMKQVHTSKTQKGRVYIPVANYVLMVAVVLTTVGFRTSNNVTAAYGLGISIDLLLTTILITIVLHYIYNYHWIVSILFFLIFGSLEACLVISGLKKFIHGAWFPLLMCAICFSYISFWRACRGLSLNNDLERRKSIQYMFGDRTKHIEQKKNTVLDLKNPNVGSHDDDSISSDNSCFVHFNNERETITVPKIDKIAFIYCSSYSTAISESSIPSLLRKIIACFWSIPDICLFVETRVSSLPEIPEDHPKAIVLPVSTSSVDKLSIYRCVVYSGFLKQTKIDDTIMKDIITQLSDLENDIEITQLPVMHIFERDLTVSKRIKYMYKKSEDAEIDTEEDHPTFSNRIKRGMIKCWHGIQYPAFYIRKVAIDCLYSPLSNGSMEYIIADGLKEKKSTESVYVGEKVYI